MLEASDVHRAVHAMLTGITSGDCLGFHRAVLFVRDGERGAYVGSQAIGPRDAGEAHRIWEQIEVERKSMDAMIERLREARRGRAAPALRPDADPAPRRRRGRRGGGGRARGRRRGVIPAGVARQRGAGRARGREEFVLAALRPHGEVLGLIYVDDAFDNRPIEAERVRDLEFFVEQAALVCENFTLLERVASLAREDALTGLLNRRELEARFATEASRARRSGAPFGLLLVDMDEFKQINDSHGHERGDEALRRVAGVLRGAVRGHDVVARFGGDEFVVLLGAPREDVAAAARRIGRLVREGGLSVSVGIATWPEDCEDTARVFSVADANLYRAKRAGRGCAAMSGREPFGFDDGSHGP